VLGKATGLEPWNEMKANFKAAWNNSMNSRNLLKIKDFETFILLSGIVQGLLSGVEPLKLSYRRSVTCFRITQSGNVFETFNIPLLDRNISIAFQLNVACTGRSRLFASHFGASVGDSNYFGQVA